MNTNKTALLLFDDDDEDCTASQEGDLEDWVEYTKRSTKEADEKMLTYNITNWVDTQKIEMAPSSPNCYTKPRNRVESRTRHLDKDPEESRKTSQKMGSRLESKMTTPKPLLKNNNTHGSVWRKTSTSGKRKKDNTPNTLSMTKEPNPTLSINTTSPATTPPQLQ